jgi:4-amino-4-deoxy-L-arabinose transferase-like glycosyltransferase
MIERIERVVRPTLARWAPALLIAGLFLFHAVNNWIWLSKNLMTRGWDRIGSLVNSLYYHETLSEFSLQALFNASIQDAYRPPLFGLSMAAMYKIFGVSADVAVMVNMLYWLVMLGAGYGIGARLGGRRLGILSTVLVALIPLMFAMSRYAYFEFSLAALTLLSIYLLLASERFEKRGASMLLGLSLGLGALIKRTFPVFVAGALVVAFFQAGLPRRIWARLRSKPRLRWRDVGIAVGGGLLLSAVWFFPNRETAQTLAAGFWLFPIWWALAAFAIFFALQTSSPETNFLACGFVALSVASVWYAPHGFEFVKQILWLAWGVEDPRGRTVDFTDPVTYTAYLQSAFYGFSPVFAFLLLLAVGLLLAYLICRRHHAFPGKWWEWAWWPVLVTMVIAYIVLSTSIYKEDRAITPLLPFFGIVLAAVLLKLPWRRLRVVLIVLTIVFGLVQFFAVSYTGPHQLVEATTFPRPILGQWSIFAQGLYLETPDSGLNDPDFWIAQDILQRVETTRQREGWDTISLGIIAYSSHVHIGMFAYDQLHLYPSVRLEDPTQTYPQESAYSTAFGYDYVVVLRNKNRRPAVREAENLILQERRSWFELGFEEEASYPLPDGSEAHLFRRRYRPLETHDPESLYQVAEYLGQMAKAEDLVVAHPPSLLVELLAYYWGPAPASTFAGAKISARHPRLFLITRGKPDVEIDDSIRGQYGPAMEDLQWGALQLSVYEPWKR